MKWNDYVMVQVYILHKNMLAKWQRRNDKMENIISERFSLHWFQHDISMVLRNNEICCFTHKPIRV